MIRVFVMAVAALAVVVPAWHAEAVPASCTVERVIDGDTFVCTSDIHIRMLQINTPESNECGGAWATSALANIFLKPGTEVRLEYDAVTTDRYGRTLAAPIVRGTDGTDYNISIVMVYVGLAKAAYYGDNAKYLDWANNSETWARNAGWNMWKPGGPFNGGFDCGGGQPVVPPPPAPAPAPVDPGGDCDPAYPDVCIPSPPPDLDCPQISDRRFTVLPPDPHGFDGDDDGIGCES